MQRVELGIDSVLMLQIDVRLDDLLVRFHLCFDLIFNFFDVHRQLLDLPLCLLNGPADRSISCDSLQLP